MFKIQFFLRLLEEAFTRKKYWNSDVKKILSFEKNQIFLNSFI